MPGVRPGATGRHEPPAMSMHPSADACIIIEIQNLAFDIRNRKKPKPGHRQYGQQSKSTGSDQNAMRFFHFFSIALRIRRSRHFVPSVIASLSAHAECLYRMADTNGVRAISIGNPCDRERQVWRMHAASRGSNHRAMSGRRSPRAAWRGRYAPASGRHRPRAKKGARCTQRTRIPVKEVSHELRIQIKEIARAGQRIDFDIDMTSTSGPRAGQSRAAAPRAHAGTSRVEQWMPPPPDAMPRMSTWTIARFPAYGRMAATAAASAAPSLNFGTMIAPLQV